VACDQHGMALVVTARSPGPRQGRPDARRDRARPSQDAGANLPALARATECFCDSQNRARRAAVENIEIFDFELADDEMARIAALASPKGRLTDFGFAPKWD